MDIFRIICCKNCNNVCLKRPEINGKEAGVGPFFKKTQRNISIERYKHIEMATKHAKRDKDK